VCEETWNDEDVEFDVGFDEEDDDTL